MTVPTTLHLTTMEEQVLDIIRHESNNWDTNIGFVAYLIAFWGKGKYGPAWGGVGKPCHYMHDTLSYPILNCCLGSLAKKGLLERFEHGWATTHQRSFGTWKLTNAGLDLLGLSLPPGKL